MKDAGAARCRGPYVHIGVLFSDVAGARDNRFLSLILIRNLPEFCRDTATRCGRKACCARSC
jgi:hypothetical protein